MATGKNDRTLGPVVAVIPARFESSRLPGKPLADISGKPMIQHVYEQSTKARGVDRVIVATDDERIRDAVWAFGGDVAMTSAAHQSGTDRIAEVVRDLEVEIVVNIQGDLPLLDPESVASAIDPLVTDLALPMATLKTAIHEEADVQNPNVVKVVTNKDGDALYFSRAAIPVWRDQRDAGNAYRHIGLYAYRRDFLLTYAGLAPTPLERAEKLEQLRALENGYRIRVAEVPHAGTEVDTPEDLDNVRMLVEAGCS